ncbi:hypothetical protein BGX29_003334 [Mortierella sp. GBA35]|nr:hypothetical protein BGX29_003334 [Mortierella sp. GBA35]
MEPFSGQATPAESFIEPESITSKDDTQAGVIVSEEAVTMLNMEESANPSSEASEEADVGEEGEQEGEIEEGDEGLQSWIEEPGDDDQDRARTATGDGDLGDIMDLEYEEEEEEGPDGFDQIKDWSQTADDGEAEGERDIEERAQQDDYEDRSPL